jgi:hypothetical protein
MNKLLIIFGLLISLVSCSNNELPKIDKDNVFLVNKDKYIVLFYSSSCYACLDALEILNKRYRNEKYQGFCVEIDYETIKISEEKESNIGKSNIEEISFYTVPYLVFICEGIVKKELYGVKEIQKENVYIFFE